MNGAKHITTITNEKSTPDPDCYDLVHIWKKIIFSTRSAPSNNN